MKYLSGISIFIPLLLILTNCDLERANQHNQVNRPTTSTNSFRSPLPTTTPLPQPTSTPTPISPSPAPTPTLAINPLPEFPLAVGNTWVYSATYTGFRFNRATTPAIAEPLTATYIITDQIVATKTYGSLFGAEIRRISSLVEGTPFNEFHNFNYDKEFENPELKTYTYVISGTQIYQHEDLSFLTETKQKAAQAYRYPLIYEFPLMDGTAFHCWYSWSNENQDCHNVVKGCDYYYYVKEQSVFLKLPAGNFKGCYTISIASCEDENSKWFCPNIGIVGGQFLYVGQGSDEYPTGSYQIKLLTYSLMGNSG